nr:prepilin-type N-terminal cleavage/methylation domain-containing protein [Sulfurospirillum tamanensis]
MVNKLLIRPAFTMIEMVFVIVILGILAAVAIPRLAATRTDAAITKGASQVSAIRSGIALQRSLRLMQGTVGYPPNLDDVNASYGTAGQNLFWRSGGNPENILENPILSSTGNTAAWLKTAQNTYTFRIDNTSIVTLTYTQGTGQFACTPAGELCNALTQ